MYKFFLYFLLPISLYSQSVNFDNILNQTIDNNKKLKQLNYDIKYSKLNTRQIEAYNLGKIQLTNEISRTNHSGYVFNSKLSSREASFKDFGFSQQNEGIDVQPKDLNYPKSRTNINTNINYSLPLFTGFKLSNQKKILKLQEKANEIKYLLDKKQLTFEVLKAYNSAVVAKQLVQATTKAKEAVLQVVKSANAFYKEGLVTKIDVKQAKVYLLNINSKLIEAKNDFDLSLAYLRFLSSNEKIKDVKELKNIFCDATQNKNIYEIAIKNRDELSLQNIKKDVMKKNIAISKSDYYPNIYSYFEYGVNDNDYKLNSNKDYYNFMIGLNYTIFDKTRDIKKEQNRINYKKALLEKEELIEFIKLQVDKSLLTLKTKEKILKEKIEAKELANEVYEQSSLMYKNQLISMTNLLEQEANLRKNEALLIYAKYENSLALANVALTLGIDFSNTNNNKGNLK